MRKTTKAVVTAFLAGERAAASNTATDGTKLTLHGNTIAWKAGGGVITMTMAGYATVTTRERLNGVCQLAIGKRPFSQKRGVQIFNGRGISAIDEVSIFVWEK